jgi:hypothetical protein
MYCLRMLRGKGRGAGRSKFRGWVSGVRTCGCFSLAMNHYGRYVPICEGTGTEGSSLRFQSILTIIVSYNVVQYLIHGKSEISNIIHVKK